jgi:hypothetical protein
MDRLPQLLDWIEGRIDRPADQSVLRYPDRTGSERMLDTDDPDQARAAAATVRRTRSRTRHRWLGR